MKKFSILMMTIIISQTWLLAQNVEQMASKQGTVTSQYDRNALTILILDNNGQYMADLKPASSAIQVPDKFDNNTLDTRYFMARSNTPDIQKALVEGFIPNNILAKWFSRKENGEFDMAIIYERGMYNATDDEVRKASATKIGLAKLKDAGESLIAHSYILVLEFKDIQTMDQVYDKMDATKKAYADAMKKTFEPVKRVKNGWEGTAVAYLYKLSNVDSLMSVFYDQMWIYEDDTPEVKAAKIAKFNQTKFPLQFAVKVEASADGSQFNPGQILAPPVQLTREQLFQKMINTGINEAIFSIERKIEDFRVKTPVYSTKPVTAKIGKKEGLRTEQRYFVYEYQLNRKGETVTKRKGVVRAKNVVDNRQVASGDTKLTSKFYQVAGHRVEEGMLMQQRNDLGIGLSGGYSIGEIGGGYAKLEINVGQLASTVVDLGITQFKIFGSYHIQTKEYDVSALLPAGSLLNPKQDITFGRWQVGISKGWYFAHVFSFVPFVAYAQESGTNKDLMTEINSEKKDDNFNIQMIDAGAYLSMNVTYWLQLIGGVNYYIPFGDVTDKDNKVRTEIPDGTYTDYFKDRQGLSIDAGLRIEF
jgi:hypothetical protein